MYIYVIRLDPVQAYMCQYMCIYMRHVDMYVQQGGECGHRGKVVQKDMTPMTRSLACTTMGQRNVHNEKEVNEGRVLQKSGQRLRT